MEMTTEKISFENTEIAFSHLSDKELKKANWLFGLMNNRMLVAAGTRLTPLAFKMKLPIKSIVKKTIFRQFCGGETMDECLVTAKKLAEYGVKTILDYGVEGKESEAEFDKTANEIVKAITETSASGNIKFVSAKVTGLARFALLERFHGQEIITDIEKAEMKRVEDRLHLICKTASEKNIGVMIDAEESWIQKPVDDLTDEMMKCYNQKKVVVMNTFQFYKTGTMMSLMKSFQKAQKENYLLGAKLVRGAYMQKENKRALELNYTSPVHRWKDGTDADFNQGVDFCFDNIEHIGFCVASHNEISNRIAAEKAIELSIAPNHPHLNFSQLLGMSDNLTFNLAKAGFNVTKYIPYGPVKDVVPYLMRRAQENTSVSGQTGRELSLIKKELKRRRAIS